METIKVKVTRYADRKFWLMYYDDPLGGKRQTRSTRKVNRRDAERAAAVWEAELREGRYKPASNIAGEEFRERYEDEVLPSLAARTDNVVGTTFRAVERILNPKRLRDLTAARLSYFQSQLRNGVRSEATIRTYLAHLKAAMNWAVDVGMLSEVPKIKMPKRAKGSKVMKGRPITLEEFERMLDKIEVVRGPIAAPSWRYLLEGLWLSGLRLGEALELWWDRDDKLRVDLDGRRPMFHIRAELEKGCQDRILPVTPDFATFLERTPKTQRTGSIFRLLDKTGKTAVIGMECVSAEISKIGKAAGVKVNTNPKTGKVKFASAHDLRRSFGERWAPRVMPVVLQRLMRHENFETTQRYYIGQNAETMADQLWAAYENVNTFVNSGPNSHLNDDGSSALSTVTETEL